jgi:hypothetical protein
VAGALALTIAAALALPALALGHGLVQREDLPVPEWLFSWAAAVVLIVSFVGLSVAWQTPRFEADRWRPAPAGISRLLVNPVTRFMAGLIGVLLLGVTVWSGLHGTEAPEQNFSVTFVFVTVWVGLVFVSALFGDVFRAFNPWVALASAISGIFRLVAGAAATPPPLPYPKRLGRWPAVAGLLAFVWLELVYAVPGFTAVGLTGRTVAIATLAYSAITFIGMALFGIREWTERGEFLSVYFAMFAKLSPLEVRDGHLGIRPALSGLTSWAILPGSAAFVLVALGATAYDGASEGFLLEPSRWLFERFSDLGLGPLASLRLGYTLLLLATLAVVAGLFWGGVAGMRAVKADLSLRALGLRFSHAFVPIALAYVIAHYFTLLVFQEQAQFTYLLSDPLGDGSNYFGTADSGIDYGVIGAEAVWYVQVGALIVGHVLALVLGHDRAEAVFDNHRQATRSQYWMLALMVVFTTLGLFLLSQANG